MSPWPLRCFDIPDKEAIEEYYVRCTQGGCGFIPYIFGYRYIMDLSDGIGRSAVFTVVYSGKKKPIPPIQGIVQTLVRIMTKKYYTCQNMIQFGY